MIKSCVEPHAISIVKIGFIVFIKSGNHNEFCPVTVDILPLKPTNDIVDRPTGCNVKFFTVISDFTLSQVSGVGLPQLVQSLLGQSNFNTRYQVITVEQSSRTIQTSIASSDRGELQGLKTLSLVKVNAAVFCVGVGHLDVGENIVPQIVSVAVKYAQTFIVYPSDKAVGVRAGQDRVIGNFPAEPCEVEDSQSGFSCARWKRDRQQIQFIVCQLLQSVYHPFQHLPAGRVELFLRVSVPLHIEEVAVKIVRSGGQAYTLVQIINQPHLLPGYGGIAHGFLTFC